MAERVYFSRVDELIRADHAHLLPRDECYFLREYTSGVGYAHSTTNDLITNFKRSTRFRELPAWKYKEAAIDQVARELASALAPRSLGSWTFVPMPPSKARGDDEYDDRILRTLGKLGARDVRELLVARASRAASHTSDARRDVAALTANLSVDTRLTSPAPVCLAIVDDVLTTGAHFRAASAVLTAAFPGVRIVGLFVSRRVFPS